MYGAAAMTRIVSALRAWVGSVLRVFFASMTGAAAVFLVARFVLRDWVRPRRAGRLAGGGRGIARNGRRDEDGRPATAIPRLYAGPKTIAGPRLSPRAGHEARHAAINALFGPFGPFKRFAVDYRHVPRSIDTEPGVARVGHNERTVPAAGREVTTCSRADHDRAPADAATAVQVRLLTAPGRDRLPGVSIVDEAVGEWTGALGRVLRHRLGLCRILSAVQAGPIVDQANRFAAGAWRNPRARSGLWPRPAGFHARHRRGARAIWR